MDQTTIEITITANTNDVKNQKDQSMMNNNNNEKSSGNNGKSFSSQSSSFSIGNKRPQSIRNGWFSEIEPAWPGQKLSLALEVS